MAYLTHAYFISFSYHFFFLIHSLDIAWRNPKRRERASRAGFELSRVFRAVETDTKLPKTTRGVARGEKSSSGTGQVMGKSCVED